MEPDINVSSILRRLGRPLDRDLTPMPTVSTDPLPVPIAPDAQSTRMKKSGLPQVSFDRTSSELYPTVIPADMRAVQDVIGQSARDEGRTEMFMRR